MSGTVVVIINGTPYEVPISSGSGYITVTDRLNATNYDVNASLTIPNYGPINNSTKFSVSNATGSFNVSVANITYGDDFTIVVADAVGVNGELLNGTVIVVINGTTYNVNVTNGSGNATYYKWLLVGDYDVNASLTVPNYNKIENSTKFIVNNATGSFNINVANITYGGNFTIVVTDAVGVNGELLMVH